MAGTHRPDPDATDRSLLRRVRAGEQDAATALYLRYADHLRALAAAQSAPALAARVDPDDIVQSVFRTFFRRVGANQYDVPDGDDLWRLFLVIALHKIRNAAIRHRAAKRDVRQTVHLGAHAHRAATADPTGLTVLHLVIDDALAGLPETARRIVELRIDGHEVADIAARVGRSKRSVERVLQQFRAALKGLLDADP
jgi:RNA polymerase sigma-70 factor (ECF subfamily)